MFKHLAMGIVMRLIVQTAARQSEQLALANHRDRFMLTFNHGSFRLNRQNEAVDLFFSASPIQPGAGQSVDKGDPSAAAEPAHPTFACD